MAREWAYEWSEFEDDETCLFEDWIAPLKLEDLSGAHVLEAGCGPGHHTRRLAAYARRVLAIDLECAEIARVRLADLRNVEVRSGDVATIQLSEQFDAVICVGMIHHTNDPDQTFANLARYLNPGGRIIVWCYAHEGNALNRWVLEPLKRTVFRRVSRDNLKLFAYPVTMALAAAAYTIYRLPAPFLPYYRYFGNWRRLTFRRNLLNVFDKLNAPLTHWIPEDRARRWIAGSEWEDRHISSYLDVSWRVSARRRSESACAAS